MLYIDSLHIKNYRVLKELQLTNLTPLSVFVGPNGSGKSTLLEALTFLSDCFQQGLGTACQKYGGISDLKSYGMTEQPIQFQMTYVDSKRKCRMLYSLVIQSKKNQPYVERETLTWTDEESTATETLLDFSQGEGWAAPGEMSINRHISQSDRQDESFNSPDTIAANTLGQFAKHPHLQTLRHFLSTWMLTDFSHLGTQALPNSFSNTLSSLGDNLTNVVEHLETNQPEQLQNIIQILTRQIPQLIGVKTIVTQGKRRLHIQDQNAITSLTADQASEGTLLLLAYLLLLQAPTPDRLLLIDEPENNLHPQLMIELGEKFRATSAHNQIFTTTHSSYFVDTLRPQELWVLHREDDGFTQARRAADMRGIVSFIDHGALLGSLWMENFFEVGHAIK
jgi:predicted ATPase